MHKCASFFIIVVLAFSYALNAHALLELKNYSTLLHLAATQDSSSHTDHANHDLDHDDENTSEEQASITHSHRHHDSPTGPVHSHSHTDPAFFSTMVSTSLGSIVSDGILSMLNDKHASLLLIHDEMPKSIQLSTVLRPPIA